MNPRNAAAAEVALKAYALSGLGMLGVDAKRDRIMRGIAESVDLTEAPDDAVCSLVIDLMHSARERTSTGAARSCPEPVVALRASAVSRGCDELSETSEIELPLLKLLHELGGKAQPRDLYPKVAELFPQLTDEDLFCSAPQ
jgi:hypothetical protein